MKKLYLYHFNDVNFLGVIRNAINSKEFDVMIEYFYGRYSDMGLSAIKYFSEFKGNYHSVTFKENEIEIMDFKEHWTIPVIAKVKLSLFDANDDIKEKTSEEVFKYKLKFPEKFI